jgi:hypothetical protein
VLLEDLAERGLLDEMLVVWFGEFGRSPQINKQAGREHWPFVYSVVFAGGGVQSGALYGASDKKGASPISRGQQREGGPELYRQCDDSAGEQSRWQHAGRDSYRKRC